METEPIAPPAAGKRHRLTKLHDIKLPLWVSLVLLVLLLVVFVWQSFAVATAERRLEAERQTLAERQAGLHAAAGEAAQRAGGQSRQLFGTALAWAVRGELIRSNLEQIDQYFSALVKTDGIELVLLADQSGKVLVASDRAFVDAPLPASFPAELLQAPEVSRQAGPDDTERLLIPIHGLNARLGTVILVQQAAR